MSFSDSLRDTVIELLKTEFDNEVGKASTGIGFGLIILVMAGSFYVETTLFEYFEWGNSISLKYIITIAAFFLLDMVVAYHFLDVD